VMASREALPPVLGGADISWCGSSKTRQNKFYTFVRLTDKGTTAGPTRTPWRMGSLPGGRQMVGAGTRRKALRQPGILAKLWSPPPRSTQGCLLSHWISIAGFTQLGSSIDPARIIIISGNTSTLLETGEPHVGQNR